MKKIAVYTRVSTTEQTTKNQEIVCKEYCKHNNFKVYNVYSDIISGSKDSRPAFNKLLEDMRHYKFNIIIVTKLDRIGRSLSHILSMFNEFAKRGVGFIAVTQNIDTTSAAGRLQLHILSAFAEFERNLISERTKEGLRNAKNVGKRGKDKRKRRTAGYFNRHRGVKK